MRNLTPTMSPEATHLAFLRMAAVDAPIPEYRPIYAAQARELAGLIIQEGCPHVHTTPPETPTTTLEQVKKKFEKEGKTFKEFAAQNNLNYRTVLCVVNGVNKGKRGEAHRVAVALGLKQANEVCA